LKIAKIGQGAVIKWASNHRSMREGEQELIDNETEDTPKPQYTSRKLACTRCGQQQETSWMQLRCLEGFRAVHCRNCGKQERSARNLCQCGTIWHQCPKHRVDPESHTSRKAAKKTKEQKQVECEEEGNTKKMKGEAINKKAPVIEDSIEGKDTIKSSKSRKEQDFYRRQARDKEELNPRMSALRARVAQRSVASMPEVAPQTRSTNEQSQMSTTRSIHDVSIQDQEKQKMRKLDESCNRLLGTANANKNARLTRQLFIVSYTKV
jgi:hypothetical protein